MSIIYNMEYDNEKNWIICDDHFDVETMGKSEAIMNIGNGYLGSRAANEESYYGEIRNTFINGTFNKFDKNEVTELPNIADMFNIEFYINDERFSLITGVTKNYRKFLNLKTGELKREFTWLKNDLEIEFIFTRFASLSNLHLSCQRIEIIPNKEIKIEFEVGINAQMSNSGSQHFHEGEKRFYDDMTIMELLQKTTESEIDFIFQSIVNTNIPFEQKLSMKRRKIASKYSTSTKEKVIIEKLNYVNTSRDRENENLKLDEFKKKTLDEFRNLAKCDYNDHFLESVSQWELFWNNVDIRIEGDDKAQLALRFANYHMRVFTPYHDNRMNCGAKGLSGEGYKGHTFWDTELFILPNYIYTDPKVARSLLEYRYLGLEGARKKAIDNGYSGAQYPWESAWITDGEVTPVWGDVDIITGESTKIWSGFLEQHVTSDIAYGVWLYYNITGDKDFMEKYGYEIIFDTANFWASRGEWNGECYNITNIIGPDEYKEHCDNNSYTNYMAKWNCELAIEFFNEIKNTDIMTKLLEKINVDVDKWIHFSENIYIHKVNKNNILPQDSSYLSYPIIDLTKYKNQDKVGGLFEDYSLSQVNKIQVTKQADVMLLMLLFENLFTKEQKIANWDYYEPKTLHDSSLSLSTHVILASDLGNKDLAYSVFNRAMDIDMGTYMHSSDYGIHAASLAGIWQSCVYGFGGIRYFDNKLRIEPNLPDQWNELEYNIYFRGDRINISVGKNGYTVSKKSDTKIEFYYNEHKYELTKEVNVEW